MSDEARTILVVTDDTCFSSQLSELMLRAGTRTLRFAQIQDALQQSRELVPDLVLIHIPRGRLDAVWACYELLQSDPTTACIPLLLYTPPVVLAQRAVGAPESGWPADLLAAPDMLIAQISALVGTGRSIRCVEPSEERFPTGRDDL